MSNLTLALNNDSYSSYLEKINSFPILELEEEQKLLRKYLNDNDLSAAHKLITSHLKLVVSIALKFRSYGLPLMDLIAEGNIGLMKAVKKFKPNKGTRLSTYAMWWIKAMIQDYILKSWSMLKISSSVLQKKLFSSSNKLKEKILSNTNKQNYIDVNLQTSSLNNKLSAHGSTEVAETVCDQAVSAEDTVILQEQKINRQKLLQDAMQTLSDREKEIISQRRLVEKPATLVELSKKFHVSNERIRQIEAAAMNKLKKSIILPKLTQTK